MRRWIALFLSICMIFSMVSCGRKEKEEAAYEKAENARPELVSHVENMEQYDTIFLEFANWWYTVPMAIHSFLEEYDFSGKTVIPFVTHGTGGFASREYKLENIDD